MDLSHFHLYDIFTFANLVAALIFYGKASAALKIFSYQHKLMWADFTERKQFPKERGASAGQE